MDTKKKFSLFDAILNVVCVVFVAVVIYLMAKDTIRAPVARWAAVVIMAGAVGNCLDRIITGYVVDMIELEFIKFPVFNVADVFITVGVIVFVIVMLLDRDDKKTAAAKPAMSPITPPPSAKTGDFLSMPISMARV